MENPKIVIATGTRADWGLLKPLADELRDRGISPVIVATHAHFFPELGDTVNEIEADGYRPLRIPTRRQPAEATADATEGFATLFREIRPDMTVVLGDRFEILGVASAALLEGVPLTHIAGGNVTRGAFDNAIRNAISQMATLHLPETPGCGERLERMGINPENIVVAGSPGVYNALNVTLMTLPELEADLGFELGKDFILATFHPATLDTEAPDRQMLCFLKALAYHVERFPKRKILLTYPNSDTDTAPLIALIEKFHSQYPDNVYTTPSLGRVRYLSAAAHCRAVIGNSSSAIEETPSLGHPTLDIGIRQEGRERGPAVFSCDADTDSILYGLELVLSGDAWEIASCRENPYYYPETPRVQADAILRRIGYHFG